MIYALIYPENADIVGTYPSWEEALSELAQFVAKHPEIQAEIGLRPFEDGRPAGDFITADDALREPAPSR